MIRVQVMASSPTVRAGLEALLREDPRFALSAASHPGASKMRVERGPEVVLAETASIAQFLAPRVRFSRQDDPPMVLLVDRLPRAELCRALRSGVRAVLSREAGGTQILAAVEAVAAGLTVLSGGDLDALLPLAESSYEDEIAGESLSARELEVLALLAEGLGNKDIAARLAISEHTVKFHVSAILGKLSATTRGEAVARGIRQGLVII